MADRGRGGHGGGRGGGRGGGGGGGYQGGGGGGGRGGGYQGGGGGGGRGGGYQGGGGRGGGGGAPRGGGNFGPAEVFKDPRVTNLEPNTAVAKTENDFIKSSSGIAGLSLKEGFPVRPGHGTQGQTITVWANYFEVLPQPGLSFFRYAMAYDSVNKAPKLSKVKEKRLWGLLLEDQRFNACLSDYKANLISRTRLPNTPIEIIIPFRAEGEDSPRDDPHQYRVTIQETGTINVMDLLKYLQTKDASTPELAGKLEIIQALNFAIGNHAIASKDIATVGDANKHYLLDRNPANMRVLGSGMEALRGYYKSVRTGTARILLNVNVTHGVFYEPIRLDRLIPKLGTGFLTRVSKYLKYLRVNRLHLPAKKNKRGQVIPNATTVWDVATTNDGNGEANPPQVMKYGAGPKEVKFWLVDKSATAKPKPANIPAASPLVAAQSSKTASPLVAAQSSKIASPLVAAQSSKKGKGKGKGGPGAAKTSGAGEAGVYISVYDYFQKYYPNVQMDPKWPVVNVGSRDRPSYLPAEVCEALPGQQMRRKLGPDETRAMIEFACRKPKANADNILQDGQSVLGLSSPDLIKFGIKISASLITVPARILQPPGVKYAGTNTVVPRNGSWNMQDVRFHTGSTIKKWTFLWIRTHRGQQIRNMGEVQTHVQNFAKFMNQSGIQIGVPTVPSVELELRDGDEAYNEERISNQFRTYHNLKDAKPDFVFIILPYNDAGMYKKIKTLGDTKAGIHTICVVGSKFSKPNRQEQYFANVALKFNLKAGGINQVLDPAKLGIISEGKTMVVGIDVTHPSPGSKENAPSVAGMVASVDRFLGQWPASLRIQESRKEMVSELDSMLKSRLELWQLKNKGQLPQNILIYRDGVSEGQYQTVLDVELPLLRKACASVYPAPITKSGGPAITIVIVGKRHHTRFYPSQPTDADRSENCKNGTVVDRGVTEVRNWDFFLQAHACLQGTARPAHYYVVLDEIFRDKKNKPKNLMHKNAADVLEDLTHNMCHLFGRATKAVSICPPAYYADLLCERARCYLGRIFEPESANVTAAASVVSGASAGDARAEDVVVAPGLRNSMFYI